MLLANLDDAGSQVRLQAPVVDGWRLNPIHAVYDEPCSTHPRSATTDTDQCCSCSGSTCS